MVLTFQNIAIHRTDNFSENGSLYFPGIFPYVDLQKFADSVRIAQLFQRIWYIGVQSRFSQKNESFYRCQCRIKNIMGLGIEEIMKSEIFLGGKHHVLNKRYAAR